MARCPECYGQVTRFRQVPAMRVTLMCNSCEWYEVQDCTPRERKASMRRLLQVFKAGFRG